jgi:hypothetical protein
LQIKITYETATTKNSLISLAAHQDGYYQKARKQQMLAKRKGILCTLAAGM